MAAPEPGHDGKALHCTRLHDDGAGGSVFGEAVVKLPHAIACAVGPAGFQSDGLSVATFYVLQFPAGWTRRHPAPAPQYVVVLSGCLEVCAGADVRQFGPGEIVLAEDTNGAHTTTALQDTVLGVVRL